MMVKCYSEILVPIIIISFVENTPSINVQFTSFQKLKKKNKNKDGGYLLWCLKNLKLFQVAKAKKSKKENEREVMRQNVKKKRKKKNEIYKRNEREGRKREKVLGEKVK